MIVDDITQPKFLKLLSLDTLRWYRNIFETMLDSPQTTSSTMRFAYALFNAEIARRILQGPFEI